MNRSFITFIAALLILLYPTLCVCLENSDWAIAITGPRNVKRERVALTVELLNLKAGVSLYREPLPGIEVLGIIESDEPALYKYLIATRDTNIESKGNFDDGIFLIKLTSSGRIIEIKYLSIPWGWKIEKFEVLYPSANKRSYVVFLSKSSEAFDLGSVCLFEDGEEFQIPFTLQIPLPYSPKKVLSFGKDGMWLIIGAPNEEPEISLFDVYLRTSRAISLDIDGEVEDIFALDNDNIGVVVNELSEESPEQSKVYSVNVWTGEVSNSPINLWGKLNKSESSIFKSQIGTWIKTESQSDGFGYLYIVEWDPVEGFSKKWETAVVGIDEGWKYYPHPKRLEVIISKGNKLEMISNDGESRISSQQDEEVTFSTSLNDIWLTASGGKTYKVDIHSGTLTPFLIAQSGWIETILPTDDLSQNEFIGVDTRRVKFSRVIIDEYDIGRYFRSVVLSESSQGSYDWIGSPIPATPETTQNIVWFIEKKDNRTFLYLNPLPSLPLQRFTYWLNFYNFPTFESTFFIPEQCIIQIKVVPRESTERKILWLFGEGSEDFRTPDDPQELKALGDILTGGPFYFTHFVISMPIDGDITGFPLVVADISSFAKGVVSIRQVSEYVKNGGNLLILGQFSPNADIDFLYYWLLSVGIYFDPSVLAEGDLPIHCEISSLSGQLPLLEIRNGALLRKIPRNENDQLNKSTRTGEKSQNLSMVISKYGKGKIGVVASKYPFSSSQLRKSPNFEFAFQTFNILSKNINLEEDTDGDNLPNSLEDRNGNQVVDIGETDPLLPDSDGDFIPDGIEDDNLNGLWEENETDPTCNDTDGDGVWDGADVSPLPTARDIVITRIEPSASPSEGGTLVFIEGRNFTEDMKFYFGRRASPFARVISPNRALVVVPEYQYDQGGIVDVSVIEKTSRGSSSNTKKFRFTPRTEVKVEISYPESNESCDITVHSTSNALFQRVILLIQVSDQITNLIGNVNDTHWTVETKPLREKWFIVTAEKKRSLFTPQQLRIQLVPSSIEPTSIKDSLKIEKLWVLNAYGGRFKVQLNISN